MLTVVSMNFNTNKHFNTTNMHFTKFNKKVRS